ncbi:unnamed protein product [Rotaria sordida]|uniref:Uncharacterized protein n=1 Tax=Rotaria sordida TaxID=392033 RepID=A0A813TXV1_9BILA|nr:unnamed protein product [Rotaria sordida]CAF0900480.1 unnamed protein product [Rotaria sordida]
MGGTKYRHQPMQVEIRKPGFKNVSIRMIKLYQNQDDGITKKLIQDRQLNLCKFAFWLCELQNGDYVRVSQISYSQIIREPSTNDKVGEENAELTDDENESFESIGDLRITQKDVDTLNGLNWLNDEVGHHFLNDTSKIKMSKTQVTLIELFSKNEISVTERGSSSSSVEPNQNG